MKKILWFLLILMWAGCATAQPIRQNPQSWQASATAISVSNGTPVTTTISIGTVQGFLQKIIVQGHNGAACSSVDFDVRICTTNRTGMLCSVEGPHSIFQKEGSTTAGDYPNGMYLIQNILFFNMDLTQSENLYVRITNNTVGTCSFDIYLAGIKTEGTGQ